MFVHIGNNIIINSNTILGIYNIDSLKENNKYQEIIDDLIGKDNITDISNNKQKSLIIVKDEIIKGFITNISSVTIAKRIKEKNFF